MSDWQPNQVLTTLAERAAWYDKIPAGLWRDVQVKAKREGVSIRALILQLLKTWLQEDAK